MKNFKKVISVVIALALVISSFTAVSASKFADVADTANYAEAVGALAALGVVNGTEENGALVFKPENQVTRAEAATMIVGALNLADEAKASAATSQFADVNAQAAWAAGYVNVGVAQGFIKGYDASTFGPLDNVTYAQLCVMLTSIAGYGEVAANRGGWPAGYTTTAAQFGMSKGVSASADTALTKGQVAMMIYNTLQVPMLGVSEFNMLANSYEQLNGKGDSGIFKTLLSDKFGGYVANVMITETPANKSGLDVDEVKFDVLKAAWWNDEEVKVSSPVTGEVTLFEGFDANAAHLQTGAALFVENEDGELVMTYFGANGDKNTKEYDAADYVFQKDIGSSNKYANKKQIKFGSTYVKLNKGDIVFYVNGVDTFETDKEGERLPFSIDFFESWMAMAQGPVRITETETDDVTTYSIFLTCYEIAKVTSVDVEDDETVIEVTAGTFGTGLDKITIDAEAVEDGDVTVAIKKNGAEADAADLKKGDIVAICVDFGDIDNKGDITVEGAIEILATDDTVVGVVSSADEDDKTYTIDGTEYYVLGTFEDVVTKTLEADLDPFGRIYADKVSATADKYAIVLSYTFDEEAVFLLADGTKMVIDAADIDTEDLNIFLKEDENYVGTDVLNRVVKYTIRTRTGELTSAKPAKPSEINGEFNTKTDKLDGNKITDATLIIDAQKVADGGKYYQASQYDVFAADTLKADTPYVGAAYGKTTDTTPFVILTAIDALYGEATRFALATRVYTTYYDEDGDPCSMVKAIYNGKEVELLYAKDDKDMPKAGDLFLYETDANGYVDTTYIVYNGKEAKAFNKIDGLKNKLADGWSYSLIDTNAEFQFVEGIVVDVDSSSITLAKKVADLKKIDTNEELTEEYAEGVVEYAFAADLKAYIYDDENEGKYEEGVDVKDAASIKASNFDRFDPEDTGVFEGDNMGDYANEAVAIIVDGDIVAIYVIEK